MSTSNKGNAPHMPQANLYRQILIYIHTSKVTVAYVNLTIKTRQCTNHFLLLLKIHFSYIIYPDYNFSFLYSSQFLPTSLPIHITFGLLTDNSRLKGNNIVLHCIVLYCTVLYCIVLYCIVLYSFNAKTRVKDKNRTKQTSQKKKKETKKRHSTRSRYTHITYSGIP